MGQLNLSQIQLGDSATASNNFVISVPSTPDGTLVIARGNVGATTQDVLTVDTSGRVSLPNSRYTSSGQTITSGGLLTLAHNLGAVPTKFSTWLICTTADATNGYSLGDRIQVSTGYNSSSASEGLGFSIIPDSTNVAVRFGSFASTCLLGHNKSTGAIAALPNGSYQFYIQAEL